MCRRVPDFYGSSAPDSGRHERPSRKAPPMTTIDTDPAPAQVRPGIDVVRISTWFGVGLTACQLAAMTFMIIVVLPNGGSPSGPALERGKSVLDAADLYTAGNYAF